MLNSLKRHWHDLRQSRPGHRFQDRYARAKAAGKSHWLVRVAIVALCVISFAIGVVLTVMPGPAVVFFFISASLLATLSHGTAKALDAAELKLRGWWRRFRNRRKRTPGPVRQTRLAGSRR